APVYVAWSASNRSPMIRIPSARGLSTRLELRSVDASTNPYLAFAAVLEAGLDGNKNGIEPPKSVDRNIYVMDEDERAAAGIADLPSTLHNALKEFQTDPTMKKALGPHIYQSFLEAKRLEWASYRQQVSEWERDQYMELY
ncbi:glutamine synthetase, partial [Rhodococcus qingshengii]